MQIRILRTNRIFIHSSGIGFQASVHLPQLKNDKIAHPTLPSAAFRFCKRHYIVDELQKLCKQSNDYKEATITANKQLQ